VQIALNTSDDKTTEVKEWLVHSGFRPENVTFDDASRERLLDNDRPDPPKQSELDVPSRHAFDILSSIPRADQERHHTLNTTKFVIRFDDQHGYVVWGLVGIDPPIVTVRWRHRVSRSLEQATEDLVAKVWESSGSGKLFTAFPSHCIVPVREPLNTSDAYLGEVLPPGPLLKQRAKEDKKTELKIFWVMLFATLLAFGLGFTLFFLSSPEHVVRWISSAFDRLATTAAATAAVSFLSYYFHLHELQRKPMIDWK
jgi:hypothetical protein